MPIPTPTLTVIADDLSGAQECIAAATRLGSPDGSGFGPSAATILFDVDEPLPEVQSLAVDVDTRVLSPEDAATRYTAVLEGIRDAGRTADTMFLKFDSLVRGPIPAQLRAAANVVGPLVFCPAVPDLNRTLLDGVIHVNGVALHETGLWHLEPDLAPESVFDLLSELYTIKVGLPDVRSGSLADSFRDASPDTQVFICDAESKEDLDRIVTAAETVGLALAGSSGLCSALARTGSPVSPGQRIVATDRDPGTLFVIGTASQQARDQVSKLASLGLPVVEWAPGSGVELPDGDCVLTVVGPVRPGEALEINSGLAHLVAERNHGRDLFLTGGQTARSILDALRIPLLHPIAQPEFGTVVSTTGDGRFIATRPGSFGAPDSLLHSHQALKNLRALSERTLP